MAEAVSKANAEHYQWGRQCDGWHLLKSQELSVIQERMPANSAEARHYHRQSQQFFYVLAGTATLEANGEQVILAAEQGFHVAAGIPHQMFNHGPEALNFLVISSPMAHGDRVEVAESA